MAARPTLKTVAQAVGVTANTVSLALRGSPLVAEKCELSYYRLLPPKPPFWPRHAVRAISMTRRRRRFAAAGAG